LDSLYKTLQFLVEPLKFRRSTRLSTDDVVIAATGTIKAARATPELPKGGMVTAWERSGGEAGIKLAAAIPV
jgi:hypothetical protein